MAPELERARQRRVQIETALAEARRQEEELLLGDRLRSDSRYHRLVKQQQAGHKALQLSRLRKSKKGQRLRTLTRQTQEAQQAMAEFAQQELQHLAALDAVDNAIAKLRKALLSELK